MVVPRGPGITTASSAFAITNRLSKLNGLVDTHNKVVLDVGCNDATYTAKLAESAALAVGIDLESKQLLTATHLHATQPNLMVIEMSAEKIGVSDASVDIVFINEALEHIVDQEQALREVYRVLKAQGILVLFAPNRFYLFETHGARIGTRKFGRFIPIVHWLPRSIGRHFMNARSYTPSELTHLLSKAGLTVTHRSCLFPPFDGLRQRLGRYQLAFLIDIYRQLIARINSIPLIRSMGLSIFIVAVKSESHQ